MAETICHGYLINKRSFQTFDEVLTFLLPTGEKLACLSLGSRRINSKNARSLFLGNYLEIQVFKSRSDDKLSKLKKVTTIKPIGWEIEKEQNFNLLNECVEKTNVVNRNVYKFYEAHIDLIVKKEQNDNLITLLILRDYVVLSGINIEVNRCVRCGNNKIKTISFADHGLICSLCFNPNKDKTYPLDTTKAIHFLFNNKLDELSKLYSEFNFVIKLLKIFIDDNLGIVLTSLDNY